MKLFQYKMGFYIYLTWMVRKSPCSIGLFYFIFRKISWNTKYFVIIFRSVFQKKFCLFQQLMAFLNWVKIIDYWLFLGVQLKSLHTFTLRPDKLISSKSFMASSYIFWKEKSCQVGHAGHMPDLRPGCTGLTPVRSIIPCMTTSVP